MAGVPFDILTEDDLTNLAKLVNYDTLIFPSFANVPAAKLAAIQDTLTTATQHYDVGLIAAGNFMTNDETGAALPGDSYARMKSLLGVSWKAGRERPPPSTSPRATSPIPSWKATPRGRRSATTPRSAPSGSPPSPRTPPSSPTRSSAARPTTPSSPPRSAAGTCTSPPKACWPTTTCWRTRWTGPRATPGEPALKLHMSRQSALVASRNDMDEAMELDAGPSRGRRPRHLRQAAADPRPVEGGLQLRRLLLHRHRRQHRRDRHRLGLLEGLLRPLAGDGQRDRLALDDPPGEHQPPHRRAAPVRVPAVEAGHRAEPRHHRPRGGDPGRAREDGGLGEGAAVLLLPLRRQRHGRARAIPAPSAISRRTRPRSTSRPTSPPTSP